LIETDNIDETLDPLEIIDEEKEKTYALLIKQATTYKDGFFKETLIKAKRAYTGTHMKAVYTDGNSG
jgi:Fanconi-associated nuclease 1